MSENSKKDEDFEQYYKKLIDTIAADSNLEEKENEQKLKNRELITLSKQHLYKIVLCDSQIRMSAGLDTTSSKHSSNMFLKSAMADFTEMLSNYLESMDVLDDATDVLQKHKDNWDKEAQAQMQSMIDNFKKKTAHQFNTIAQAAINTLSNWSKNLEE